MLVTSIVVLAAAAQASGHIDPAWLVAIAGLIGSFGGLFHWLSTRREARLREHTEPEVSMAAAYRSGVEGFNSLVRNLQTEVARLTAQVNLLEGDLAATTQKLIEVQADLASNVTENRRLRSELAKMNNMLAALDKSPDPGVPPRKD